MMTNKLFFRLVALLLLMGCRAEALSFRIEAKISITNTPATSNLLTLNGQSKMWRTNILDATTQIQITNSIGGHRTNLYNHCNSYPFTNNISVSYGTNTNDVILLGQKNQPMLASLSGTWGFITFKTNAVYDGETQAAGTNNVGRASMTNEASATVAMMPASTNRIPAGITAMDHFVDKTSSGSVSNKNLVGGSLSNTVAKRLEVIAQTTSRGGGYLDFSWAAPQSGVDPSGNGSGLRFYDGTTNTFIMLTWNGEDPYVTMRWGTNTGDGPFDPIDIGPAVDVSSLVDLTVEQSAGLLLNAKSATHMFPIMDGAAISFGASGWTNNWKSINIFTTSTNEFNTLTKFNGGVYMLSGFGSNMFFLRPTISNAVAITVTNLQAFGGYLSNFFSQNIVSSNTASYNNLLGGTSVITGMLSLGPATAISSIAAGGNFLDVGTNTHIRLTGTPGTNWTLTGIKQGSRTPQDGDMVLIEGDTGFSATIANESALVTTGNEFQRIRTYNGGDTTSSGDFLALAYYKGSLARWQWAWWNRGSGTGSGSQATNVINTGNELWVDGRNGDDSAAQPWDLTHRYKTIGAAKTNANPGDTIYVLPALYTESNLMKSNIAYVFMAGAVVSNTVPTNTASGYGIFDDRPAGAAGPFSVTGDGEFIFRNSNPTCANAYGAIVITNAITKASITGKRILVSTRNTGFINAIYMVDGRASFFRFEELADTFEQWSDLDPSPTLLDSNANGVYWGKGDMHVYVGRSRFGAGYCLWPDEPAGGATNSLWYRGETLYTTNITAVYGRSSSTGYRVWVEALEIMGSTALNLSGPGKFYVTAQKIFTAPGSLAPAITSTAETWITAQKVSGAGGSGNAAWVSKPANSGFVVPEMHLTVQQYEDLGSGVNPGVINQSTNNLFLHGGYMKANTNGTDVVKHAGTGKTYLDNVFVDGTLLGASAYPVTVSSNGLVLLNGATILAGASGESIHTNGTGATLIEAYGQPFTSKGISPTLVVSNDLLRASGDTNAWRGTNVAGSIGDVLTKGPRGLYFTPLIPAALNPNQFDSSSGTTNIKAGVLLTNVQATVTAGTTNNPLEIRDVTGAIVANVASNGVMYMKGAPSHYTLYVQRVDGTAFTNLTTVETSVLGLPGKGSKTIGAGLLQQDSIVLFRGSGKFWSSATTPNTTFYWKLGSTVVAQRNFTSLTSRTGASWEAELTMRCATNGVAGTGAVSCDGFLKIEGSSLFGITNTMTLLDTTPALAFDMSGTNTTTTMSFQSQNARLELLP